MKVCVKQGNEPSDFIIGGKFLDWLTEFYRTPPRGVNYETFVTLRSVLNLFLLIIFVHHKEVNGCLFKPSETDDKLSSFMKQSVKTEKK
jgi:hypothetical protein